jgi:SNF2 family DNA or RNA helicase
VVAPTTVLENWRDEAAKFVEPLRIHFMPATHRSAFLEKLGAASMAIWQ